jgi:CheY-like chemotaxis protein
VTWQRDAAGDLIIDWLEFGGPVVQAPLRQGFGTTIIQRSVPYDLKGQAQVWYKPAGFEAQFIIPARYVRLATEDPRLVTIAQTPQMADSGTPLSGRVLLVEDNLIIAMDAEDILTQLGATAVLTVSNVAQALETLKTALPDIAVLDINLGEETSFPVADALKAAGVRYVFATGYGDQLRLPEAHAGTPTVKKPYTAASLSRLLESD